MMSFNRICVILIAVLCLFGAVSGIHAQELSALNGMSISAQWFLSYLNGESDGSAYNYFTMKRGYLNFKKQISAHLSTRITPDVSVDGEGDGRGDIEMRIKYCYLRYKFNDVSILTQPSIEFGVAHRPWIDFEQNINPYRVQGTLFLERAGIVSSADFGVTAFSLLGGEIDQAYQDNVNSAYPGRYGSLSFGIYNGGGYHAIEENRNKTLESRITLRPLPDFIPGLQFSYHGIYGKGNTALAPDWEMNSLFLSMEHRIFTTTATWFNSLGNGKGSWINDNNQSVRMTGYSLFADVYTPVTNLSVFARHDHVESVDTAVDDTRNRWISGIAYHLPGGSKILVNFDHYKRNAVVTKTECVAEIAIELKY
ncbi:MAG: hypothetical protein U5R06_24565 [candidate division KSB1 bacterium]|nr:hypothetical protein [candidate division KSB1 bacterium]